MSSYVDRFSRFVEAAVVAVPRGPNLTVRGRPHRALASFDGVVCADAGVASRVDNPHLQRQGKGISIRTTHLCGTSEGTATPVQALARFAGHV